MLRIALIAALLVGFGSAFADTIEEKVAVCSACHGANGIPEDKSVPIIWGQHAGYLYLDLRDYQKGARKSEIMSAILQNLAREDLLALAEYFAARKWPNIDAPAASKADAEVAIAVNKSVVCTSCHLEQFQGDSSIPRLAGQRRDYLNKTMIDFRDHSRANNPGMSGLCNTITPEQIAAMAAYLAGL
jgi:cytochrome c553